MIFDTHTHYDDERFDEDRDQILSSLNENGISGVLNVGAARDSLPKCMDYAHTYGPVYAAVGLHPDEVGDLTDTVLAEMEEDLKDPKCVAVGEIGLDYHWNKEDHETQIRAFRTQIELALANRKPILVHSRDAAEDTVRVLKDYYPVKETERPVGIMHCFSYSPEIAREVLKMGFVLGIGGVVTFKNAKKLKETVAGSPLSALVLETDCPYLAPDPFRGERNSSFYLPYVVSEIAGIKGVTEEEVERVTETVARNLFSIED